MVPNLEEALAGSGDIIGHLMWFDCENAHITPGQLKNLFNKYGLNEDYLPEDIKFKNAFQKACRQVMTKTGQSSDTRKSVTKLIIDGMDKIVYGIVDLDVDQDKESINPDFSDRVWLDKGSCAVQWDHGHPASKMVKKIYDQLCGEYTSKDISRMVVRSMNKLAGISLRKAGVVYFVPVSHVNDLQALKSVVNSIGQCNMQTFAVGAGKGNKETVTEAAKNHINDKIQVMKNDIAELKQSIQDGTIKGKVMENSIDVRLRRYRELKEKCGILADALRVKSESLEGELESVGKLIKMDLERAA